LLTSCTRTPAGRDSNDVRIPGNGSTQDLRQLWRKFWRSAASSEPLIAHQRVPDWRAYASGRRWRARDVRQPISCIVWIARQRSWLVHAQG
jgi:hypothetical protein